MGVYERICQNVSFLARTHTRTHTHNEEFYILTLDIVSSILSELNPHKENDEHVFHTNFITKICMTKRDNLQIQSHVLIRITYTYRGSLPVTKYR